jgi:hypothetical protein
VIGALVGLAAASVLALVVRVTCFLVVLGIVLVAVGAITGGLRRLPSLPRRRVRGRG